MDPHTEPLLVLYDGDCRFCRACARWGERRDRHGRLDLTPYQDCPSPPMTNELRAACAQALHVLRPDGQASRGGKALLDVLGALGWHAGWLRRRPLIWAVEGGYRLAARNRGLLSRLVPS